jgi:acetylornithine deacetylase/succinyl-diaminopimelate desuccinylase-like protein
MRRSAAKVVATAVAVLAVCVCSGMAIGLPRGAGERSGADDVLPKLLASAPVKAALDAARAGEPRAIEDQVELTQIPAPGFHEERRAEVMKRKFEQAGLRNVRIDKAGNVIGERPGASPRPNVVLAAHLDTVFPEGTDVTVKREGTVLSAPGIGDDGRGLGVLLGVARALDAGRVQTPGTITFVADVGEEGLSDLRGMKQLFGETLAGRVDAFVSVDGSEHGITNVAVGSHRYRVTFRGPGGHSFGAFGLVNPIHALGRAVARIADFKVPQTPRVTFNVGRIGGGTSVNSIAYEAWLEIDMRSSDGAALAEVDASFQKAVDQAVAAENTRWGNGQITAAKELVGDRPAGRTADTSAIVRTAVAVNEALGLPVRLGEGSTDANVPISLGIPAITVGGGGRSSGGHSLSERFDSTESWKGTQRVLLLVVALAREQGSGIGDQGSGIDNQQSGRRSAEAASR